MTRHIVRCLVLLLPTLLGISLAAFVMLRLIPGDPIQIMLGERATAEQVALFRADRGLDQPLPVQYLRYLMGLLRGDWGRSIKTNVPVIVELTQRLPATIELSLGAMVIACIVGIPAGVLAAYQHNSLLDLFISGGTLIGVSMPMFCLGLLLGYLFGYRLGWLPPSGRLTLGVEFSGKLMVLVDALRHLVLPSLTLSVVPLASIVHMTRSSVLNALAQDYVRTARAKGLAERAVLFGHAFRSILPTVLTVIGMQAGSLLSGAILTEAVFSWPGIGQYVVDRILARDYPAVQGAMLVIALLLTLINLATDVCYVYLDPRIRYGDE